MKRSFRVLVILLVAILAASTGLSLALRIGWARRPLLAKLSAGFGRPVEVGYFGFNPFSGLRLEAQSVTVAEDPRFGQEYFLRAEKLTASLRWSALLFHGRVELGTVSLSHPSLNLVRLPDGQWNIESWLPPLPQPNGPVLAIGSATETPSASRNLSALVSTIEVDAGRINFKRDTRKLPLALVAVNGRLDYDGAGHWNIDVHANPLRAPTVLQQSGTLRVRGVIGGVSARLRPAALDLAWDDASLADFLRLVDGADHGIRGSFGGQLSTKIAESPASGTAALDWIIEGKLRIQDVHGWAVAGRTSDPGVNLSFQGIWNPSVYRLHLEQTSIETPHSQVNGALDLDWSKGFNPQLKIISAHLALSDLFAWRRAFVPGAENITAEGTLDSEFSGSGWPMQVERLSFESSGVAVRVPQLPEPIRINGILAEWTKDYLKLRPVSAFLPSTPAPAQMENPKGVSPPRADVSSAASNVLHIQGDLGPFETLNRIRDATYRLTITGATRRGEDLLAITRAWRGSGGLYNVTGPVSLQLSLNGAFRPRSFELNGTIQARGLQIATAMLNQPVVLSSVSMDLHGNQRRISVNSAEAFGANWTGSLHNDGEAPNWDFDLSADHLSTVDLDAWLGTQARPNLLRRMLPFGASNYEDQARIESLAALQARGHIRVGQILLSSLNVEKIDTQAILDGPSIFLKQGRATAVGGQFVGDFEAHLLAEPSFTFDGRFARVDLRDFSEIAEFPSALSGFASGELKLAAFGADRAAVARSLQGRGLLRIRDASSSQTQWTGVLASEDSPKQNSLFSVNAAFQVAGSRIQFDKAQLAVGGDELGVSGTVDFARRIDLNVQSAPRSAKIGDSEIDSTHSWTITGTLDAPKIVTLEPAKVPNGLPLARR